MNKQEVMALACLMLAGGCSAPKSFTPEEVVVRNEGITTRTPMVRTEAIVLLPVDAASVYRQMISYFTTDGTSTSALPVTPAEQRKVSMLQAALAFKPGSTELLPAYGGNRMELERTKRELQGLAANGGELQQIRITGYASPDGNSAKNEELALGRALRFRRYLSGQVGLPEQKIVVEQSAEDWDGLKRLTGEMRKPYAAKVAAVLAQTTDPDARRKALKALDGGKVWKDMENTLFARLRRMQLAVEYETTERVAATASAAATAAPRQDVTGWATLFRENPEALQQGELLSLAEIYRPGTEQYREVYEVAAYRFPDCSLAQLNAGAAALEAGDVEAARFFLEQVKDDQRAWLNIGVLCLMENNADEAQNWFRKAMPVSPAKARRNMEWTKQLTGQLTVDK